MTGSPRRLARTLALASLLVGSALATAGQAHAQPQGRNVELLSHRDKVTDHFPTPGNFRVRFVAQDLGAGSVVEAAIDDLMFFSGSTVTAVEEEVAPVPRVTLGAPRPSPTTRGGDFDLAMPRSGPVIANLYDMQGRLARAIFAGTLTQGRHTLRWDGTLRNGAKAAAGVYWLELNAAGEVRTRKIVVVK